MRVANTFVFDKNRKLDDQIPLLQDNLDKLFQLAQGRITFGTATDGNGGENVAGEFQVVADTGTINTEFSVTHTIGVVPTGFLVININKGGVIYTSGTSWTSTTIYLKCSTSNTNVSLFLLR